MAKERAVIFITKNTLQTFKVIGEEYEPLYSKGIAYIDYTLEENGIEKYVETLKAKYKINDFSEIEIKFSLINLGAEEKYLETLKNLLGTERVDLKNVEKLIPLILASNGEIKTNTFLQEENQNLKKKLAELENLNSELNKEIEKLKNQFDEYQKQQVELEKKRAEDAKQKEILQHICRSERAGIFVKNFDSRTNVEVGQTIGAINTNSPQTNSYFSYRYGRRIDYEIKAKISGKIFYMVNQNSKIEQNQIVAVIGDKNWTKEDALNFLKKNKLS